MPSWSAVQLVFIFTYVKYDAGSVINIRFILNNVLKCPHLYTFPY